MLVGMRCDALGGNMRQVHLRCTAMLAHIVANVPHALS
jgi:hypothetical protein